MKKLSKREKILLTICGALIIIYGYYSLFLTPVLKNITALHEQIDRNSAAIININLVKLQNKKQNDELSNLQAKLEDASNALPKSEESPEIINELKKLADTNGVIINSIGLGKSTDYKNLSTASNNKAVNKNNDLNNGTNEKIMITPVTLNTSGSYLNIIDFVSAVEAEKRIVEMNTLNINTDSGGTTEAIININYYYIDSN